MSVLPIEKYWQYLETLTGLGMKNLPSSQLLLECSRQLDLIVERTPYGENVQEDSKRKSFVLVEAVCKAFGQIWAGAAAYKSPSQMKVLTNGKKEMEHLLIEHLLEAASLRILLVSGRHPKARANNEDNDEEDSFDDDSFVQQRVGLHVTLDTQNDLPEESNLWLSPMKGVVLPGDPARLAWAVLPIVQHNNLSPQLDLKLNPDQMQLQWLIKHCADELNGMGVYTSQDKLPMGVLASQLRRVSIAAAKHPEIQSRFKASSLLAKDVLFMYRTMQRQLQDDNLSKSKELSKLKKVPCIYHHQKADASGLFDDDGYACFI